MAHKILETAQSSKSSLSFLFDFGLGLDWDLDSGLSTNVHLLSAKFIIETYDLVRKHIDQQIAVTHEDDKTVLASLIKQCGRDSVIPTVFAVDALQAGSETTGLQSNFLLYNVARSPEVQEKLYTEICDTIGPQGRLTVAALAKMNYTKACLTEAMRINPVSLGGMRLIERDTVIGGYQVE